MMKSQIKHIIIACLAAICAAGISSCSDDTFSSVAQGDKMSVKLGVGIPQFDETTLTRLGVCDPDGDEIKSIYLLCFDKDGNFLAKVQANYTLTTTTQGSLTADIPANTCRMHVLANVNVTNVDNDHYAGLNENTLMASLYSGQGLDNFWGYYRAASPADLKSYVENSSHTIHLVRNQAQITVSAPDDYNVVGITVCNMNAFGTVVPMDYSKINDDPFTTAYTGSASDPLTLLTDDKNAKADNPTDVDAVSTTAEAIYNIFENKNAQDDPLAVILKVTHNSQTKYHKILLMDKDANFIQIHRNHRYNINITELDDAGYDNFAQAVNGTAANNFLITIEDIIPSINYDGYELSITKGTNQVLQAEGDAYIQFTCKKDGNAFTSLAAAQAVLIPSWGTLGGVADKSVCEISSYNTADGTGMIHIKLNAPGTTMQHGILYLAIKGTIIKKPINIYTVSAVSFEPFRVSEHVDDAINKNVAVTFNIPYDFPAALLPLTFKISINRFDAQVKNSLQVVNEETADGVWNYKYLYKATQVGPQRVYFKTVDSGYTSTTNPKNTTIYLEDEKGYFTKQSTNFTFVANNTNVIRLSNPNEGTASQDYLEIDNLGPTKGQTVTIDYTAQAAGDLHILTKNFTLPDATSSTTGTDGITDYYYQGCTSPQTFVFTSKVPRYDETIWFKSATNQSASAIVRTKANYTVLVTTSDKPKYGKGNAVNLDVTFPKFDGTISYTIITKNLTAVEDQGLVELPGVGYKITPNLGNNTGETTLKFTTNKLIANETIKILASDENANDISLIPGSCTIDNAPISGTMTSTNGFNSNNFAYIEDASGNRIGSITMTGTGTTRNYTLRLYSYYTLSMTEQVKIHITDPNKVDRFVATTIGTLISNGDITLN